MSQSLYVKLLVSRSTCYFNYELEYKVLHIENETLHELSIRSEIYLIKIKHIMLQNDELAFQEGVVSTLCVPPLSLESGT